MNAKHLVPSYRTRYRFVESSLREMFGEAPIERLLHIGAGEGDYDRMLLQFCEQLDSCDINEDDIEFARELNRDQERIRYAVQDGQSLDYATESFDGVVCIEVVEHVDDLHAFISEIRRVLKPGCRALITGPNHNFPGSYDPLNRLSRRVGLRLPFGAYGYGHTSLISEADMEAQFAEQRLLVLKKTYLSRGLVGLAECYWPSVAQRLLKKNSGNSTARTRRKFVFTPGRALPPGVSWVDRLIEVDEAYFRSGTSSIGLAYLIEKVD